MNPKREEVLKYLNDMRQHYATYHNHKEIMAWAGVALYFVLLAGLIRAPGLGGSWALKLIGVIAVICIAIVVRNYVSKQFSLKSYAANAVAACAYLYADLVAKVDKTPAAGDFDITPTTDKCGQSPYVLPKFVQEKLSQFESLGQAPGRTIESSATWLVVIGGVFGGIIVLLQKAG